MLFSRRRKLTIVEKLRNFLWPRTGFQRAARYLTHRVNRINATPHAIAMGFAAGAFASFTPFLGFHFMIAALSAWILRGNILASAIGTVVGNPLTFPLIWVGTHRLGAWMLGLRSPDSIEIEMPPGGVRLLLTDPHQFAVDTWAAVGHIIWPMAIGSVPLGVLCGAACYWLIKPLISGYQHRRSEQLRRRLQERRAGDSEAEA